MKQYFIDIYDTVKSMMSGMSLTMQHLRNKKDLVATLQYPSEKWPQPERNIGFDHKDYNVIRSRLHVDIDDCIGCLQCERACPVDCIKIDTIKPPKDSDFDCGKTSHDTQKKMIVPRFSIDMSECMYCNLCVYPCPEECIYMVGGPNEPKHDIDYEYSKYVKHDLVFEFSNVTDEQIVDIGGQSYLDKRNEVSNKMDKGFKLEGLDDREQKDDSSKIEKSNKHIDPGFIVFKSVKDKMSRGIAKKAYTYGRRNDFDMIAISKYVNDAINSYNKMTPDMEEAIRAIVDFKYPEAEDNLSPNDIKDTSSNNESQNNEIKTSSSSKNDNALFDIKKLNDIEDKVVRGSLKKIYMGGKRAAKSSNQVVDEMINYLNDEDKSSDDLLSLLNSFKSNDSDVFNKEIIDDNHEDIIKDNLFDIKKLNDIEDKVVRGTLKKIYMAGKRNKLSSSEVVDNMINELKVADKLDDSLSEFIKGLK
tara:strand:+ start:613 stop:2034 length:1422 start_codon:yes stop_codon:yes gene_type:complete